MSGAKSDAGDAHVLADMVRTDSHQLRPVAGDSAQAAAVKVVTRTHKTLIWERTRHTQRLRHALRDYFPAALEAFEDLDAAGHPGTAGPRPGPGVGGEADHRADQRRPQARPPPRHRGEGGADPGRAARRRTWASPPS